MSPEIVSQGAMVAGAAVGWALERRAIHNAAVNAERIELEAATAAIEQTEVEAAAEQPSRGFRVRQWIGRNAMAPLTMLVAGAAGLATYAYNQDPEVIVPPTQPKLEMVVDHSGATNLTLGGTRPVVEVNRLAREINGKDVRGEALVAGSGIVRAMPIKKVNGNVPFGPAPLEQATSLALDKSSANAQKGENSVLVITNGNSVGDTERLTAQAKHDETPVFVVNVEGKGQTSRELTDDLKQMADETGGQYWDANKGNLSEVADSVQSTLAPAEVKSSRSFPWPIVEFGAMLAIAGAGYFRRRSEYATLKNFKGE